MHSGTLVSGTPSSRVAALSRAGSPNPNKSVRSPEEATRRPARNTVSGAILTDWWLFRGRPCDSSTVRGHDTPPVTSEAPKTTWGWFKSTGKISF